MSTTYFSSIKLRNAGTVLTVSDPNAITTSSLTSTISGLNTRLDAIEESITSLIGRLEAVEAFGTRITAIEEALANQGGNNNPGTEEPGGNDNPGTEEFVPVRYTFTSYADANKTTQYATGIAITTGETTTIDSTEYTEIEVEQNTIAGFVGNKFFIASDATADGQTPSQLYNSNKEAQPIWVTITLKATTEPINGGFFDDDTTPVIYSFTSYADANKTTQYATGIAKTTGVTAINYSNNNNFTEIEVIANSISGFAGRKFLILSNAVTDGATVNQLYNNQFETEPLYVTVEQVTEVEGTVVDHRNFGDADVQAKLADYYANYPVEARQDGTTWPPFTASKFPWLLVNYNFNGNEELIVYFQGNKVFDGWKPSAMIDQYDNEGHETGTSVARTYAILSVPDECHLTDYVETVAGTDVLLDPADFKVYIK